MKYTRKTGRRLVVVLSLIMLITMVSCGKGGLIGKNKGLNADAEKAGSVETEKLTKDSVVVAVGDETASYREMMVYMYILKTKYQDVFGDEVWTYKLNNGRTMSSVAIEQVISMITEMRIISRQASERGIELTGDEIESIRRFSETIYNSATEEDRKEYYLDTETITNVFCENELASKVFDSCITGVASGISDEDAKQITIQYLYLQTNGPNQNGIEVTLSEKEAAKKYKEAKRIRKNVKEIRDFKAYAQSNTDAVNVQITFGRGDMSDEFTDAAMKLKPGEFSPVVTAPEGYYIIYCVSDNEPELTLQKKEELIKKAQKENFESQYNEWSKNYEVVVSELIL